MHKKKLKKNLPLEYYTLTKKDQRVYVKKYNTGSNRFLFFTDTPVSQREIEIIVQKHSKKRRFSFNSLQKNKLLLEYFGFYYGAFISLYAVGRGFSTDGSSK